jgi:transposase
MSITSKHHGENRLGKHMIHLGIDVAKDELVIFDGTSTTTITNKPMAIDKWLAGLPQDAVIALESTGIYSLEVSIRATNSGRRVFMLQPGWVKASAKAKGTRSKTDRIDARLIREFLIENQSRLHIFQVMDEEIATLRKLFRFYQAQARNIAKQRHQMKCLQIESSIVQLILDGPQQALKNIQKQMNEMMSKMQTARCIRSIPGVGLQGTAACICALEHIPFQTEDAFVAYAGLDPVAKDSGTTKGQRRISKKGDKALRTALFMCAIAATRTKEWKPRYEQLKTKLKPRQAIIALARQIAKLAFHLHRKQELFKSRTLDR